MKIYLFLIHILFNFLLIANSSLCQNVYAQNLTVYPYGGKPNIEKLHQDNLLKKNVYSLFFENSNWNNKNFNNNFRLYDPYFKNKVYFENANFSGHILFADGKIDDLITFSGATIEGGGSFLNVNFKGQAIFKNTIFNDHVNFNHCIFNGHVDFSNATFFKSNFWGTKFQNKVEFVNCKFEDSSLFMETTFYNKASFSTAKFIKKVNFEQAKFMDEVNFHSTIFDKGASFFHSYFKTVAAFDKTKLSGELDFSRAIFGDKIDFSKAIFKNSAKVNFSGAKIINTLIIGNLNNVQNFDLRLAQLLPAGKVEARIVVRTGPQNNIIKPEIVSLFGPGAQILLNGPAYLKIHAEQFPFIDLPEEMDYFSKKFIIEETKLRSFPNEQYKSERFEMDYLFAKSTLYQREYSEFQEKSFFDCFVSFLYNITLGLGYRPFRIIYWIFGLWLVFAAIYLWKFPYVINNYLAKIYDVNSTHVDRNKVLDFSTFLNCLYFSAMVLLRIRLKGTILTHFDNREKMLICVEWLFGICIIIAFFTFSKSGSILHNLKDLIAG